MVAILQALHRARLQILTVGLAYLLSVLAGAAMVHHGQQTALDFRDKVVAKAHVNDRAAIASDKGKKLVAALWDFGENLVLGAIPETITGLTVIAPYALAVYRGWIGGIVSVDSRHQSRLHKTRSGVYYVLTLLLQLIPYSLAGGVGVKLGLSYFRADPAYKDSNKILGYPVEGFKDVIRVYALVVPLFLIASLWEFLSSWN